MKQPEKLTKKLNDLLEKNVDAQKYFKSAAADVENQELRDLFDDMANRHYSFGHELVAEIRNFGQEPDEDSDFGSDMKRTWKEIKAGFGGNDEKSFTREMREAENSVIKEYEEIIPETEFPPSTANLLLKQKKALVESRNKLEELGKVFS